MTSFFSRLLFLAAAAVLSLLPAHATEPPFFEARFENDAEGTWLVYPTIPGWHYRIEASPTTADASFAFVPGSFCYGNGADRRWWIAPPPPPSTPPDPPPAPPEYYFARLHIHVASEINTHTVEVLNVPPQGSSEDPWSVRLTKTLPVRPWPIPFFNLGHSPTERWMIHGQFSARPLLEFDSPPAGDPPAPNTPEARILEYILDHWEEMTSHFTPTQEHADEVPDPPTGGTIPPMDDSIRRFLRVKATEIDSNGNFIADWWELQYGYSAFAQEDEAGYAHPTYDPDGDGLSNLGEANAGTDPHNWDSDGDWSSDNEELGNESDPRTPRSVRPAFLRTDRRLTAQNDFGAPSHRLSGSYTSQNGVLLNWYLPAPGASAIGGLAPYQNLDDTLAGYEFPPFPYPNITNGPGHDLLPFPQRDVAWAGGGLEHTDEHGGTLAQTRLWYRAAAPEDAALTRVCLVHFHNILRDPAGNETPSVIHKLAVFTIPPGGRKSNPVDIQPGFISTSAIPTGSRETTWVEMQELDGTIIDIGGQKYVQTTFQDTNGNPLPQSILGVNLAVIRLDEVVETMKLLAIQLTAHRRGTINVPGEAVPCPPGSDVEIVSLENADYDEGDWVPTHMDAALSSGRQDAATFVVNSETDDDFVKLHFVAMIAGVSGTSEIVFDQPGQGERMQNDDIQFHDSNGVSIHRADLTVPDIANPSGPLAPAFNGGLDLFLEIRDLGIMTVDDAEADSTTRKYAQLKWKIVIGGETIERKVRIYRGGFWRCDRTNNNGTLALYDGKGRLPDGTNDLGVMVKGPFPILSGRPQPNGVWETDETEVNFGPTPMGWYGLFNRSHQMTTVWTENGTVRPQTNHHVDGGNDFLGYVRQGPYCQWAEDGNYNIPGKGLFGYDSGDDEYPYFDMPASIHFKYELTEIGEFTTRTVLQIHPDGLRDGTAGCIGLQNYQDCCRANFLLRHYFQTRILVD